MTQSFTIAQYPGIRLEFKVMFNTEEPNTVYISRGNELVVEVKNFNEAPVDDALMPLFDAPDGYLDLGKNKSVTAEYKIECYTEVGASYGEIIYNDTTNGSVMYGFDDRRGTIIDYDDARVEVIFSE